MILNNRFNLETLRISFIKCSFSKVEKGLKDIVFNTFTKRWKQTQYELKNASELSTFISKSDSETIQCLIWCPKSIDSDLVVFITNMSDGWQSLINIYFSKSGCDIIRITLSDNLIEYPFYSFEYKMISGERLIRSMKDSDKWEFFEKGSIMQFENKEYYKKRKIADRMNNEIIIEYLKKNQIDITQEEFWVSRGEAIEFSTNLKEQ